MTTITIDVRGHRGETLVITKSDRAEHVLDALFDDTALVGLRRVELTREGIVLSFANEVDEKHVRTRVLQLLGPPRWKVVDSD